MDGTPSTTLMAQAPCDTSLLNRLAWRERWANREASRSRARAALDVAKGANTAHAVSERGLARRTLAWQAKWRGDFDRASSHCIRAEALLTERDNPSERGDIYSILGVIHYSRNRIDLARGCVERGLQIVCKDGRKDVLIDLLTTRATIQRYSGNTAKASATLDHALSLCQGHETARVEHNVARVLLADGAVETGLELAEMSVRHAEETGNRVILPYSHEVAGACLSRLKRCEEAAAHFDTGLAIAVEDEDMRAQCQIIRYHGDIERELGNLERARDLYRHGLGLCEEMSYPLWQKAFLLSLAEINEALGNLGEALENHRAAWRLQDKRRT